MVKGPNLPSPAPAAAAAGGVRGPAGGGGPRR